MKCCQVLRAVRTAGLEHPRPVRAQRLAASLRPAAAAVAVARPWSVALRALVARGLAPPADPSGDGRLMLAVLPFENLGRPEDEYFGSGLAEEITSRLGKVQGLGVISRTSASQYGETAKSVREIGRELGVDYVLEGSVRWEGKGGAIRVTPQLVRVSDDRQLWSERYDAKLANVFEVQATIAEQVARSLDLALTAPERQALAARPTGNLEAYAYYLRGNDYLVGSWGEDRRLSIAMEMYAKAVELDPGFALAHAKLSQAHSSFYASTIGGTDEDVRVAKARRRPRSGCSRSSRTRTWRWRTTCRAGRGRTTVRWPSCGSPTSCSPTARRWWRRWDWWSGGAEGCARPSPTSSARRCSTLAQRTSRPTSAGSTGSYGRIPKPSSTSTARSSWRLTGWRRTRRRRGCTCHGGETWRKRAGSWRPIPASDWAT